MRTEEKTGNSDQKGIFRDAFFFVLKIVCWKKIRSTTDPENGCYVKEKREKSFAYSFHTVCDANGFVLASHITGATVHDRRIFTGILDTVMEKVKPVAVAADAGYKTPHIAKYITDLEILSACPAIFETPDAKRLFKKV